MSNDSPEVTVERPPRGRDIADTLKLWYGTFRDAQQTKELPDGFALGFPTDEPHLGLPAWTPELNRHSNTMPYPKTAPATRQHLAAYFAPHNERLFDLLGERFEWGE